MTLTKAQQAEARSHANLKKGRLKLATKPRLNHTKFPLLIQSFIEGASAKTATEASGFSRAAVNRFIKSLRSTTPPCLHISTYEIIPGRIVPVYELGYGKDSKMPPSLTQSERSKRYREKRRMLKLIQATAGAA